MSSPTDEWIRLDSDYQLEYCCANLERQVTTNTALVPARFKETRIVGGVGEYTIAYCPYCGQKFNLKHNPPNLPF